MKFQTKKDLLRYLGKNEDDRKLVDRMIARGEVIVENRMYVIEDKVAEDTSADLEYLNKEYEKLEESRERAIRKCYDLMVARKIFDPEKNTFEDVFNWAIGD